MDPRTRTLFVAILLVMIGLGLGATLLLGVGGSPGTAEPVGTQSVVGVIVRVDSAGLDKVRGFTLRSSAGESLIFDLRALENGAQFAPGHLVEHQATGQPVRVSYRMSSGVLLAIRLEDAP